MEECLICKARLEYLQKAEEMQCALCGKKEMSKTRCVEGHFVCSDCHTAGMDSIFAVCLAETSGDPIEIMEKLMSLPFCHMHGPEHHVMVAAALLTAYHNAGGETNLEEDLKEIQNRGREVPGGSCGFWGACGAGVSTGIFFSVATAATPLTQETWGLANTMTAKSLGAIGEVGGPRCCKRDSYLAILTAIDFVKEKLGIEMKKSRPVCSRCHMNNQCIGIRCPFFPKKER
ncbi:MAG: SAM-dependent methyltransferase [Oscillospiraceae bacterium]|nr:SAM-dependent methyltransferase [Oscillospiraceae bacterium]